MARVIASTEYEARILDDYFLTDGLYEDDWDAVDSRPYGVPVCLDGRDRYEHVFRCGCSAFYVYEHADDELPGFKPCGPGTFLYRCEGYRSAVADEAGFIACDEHAEDAAEYIAGWLAEDMADLLDQV